MSNGWYWKCDKCKTKIEAHTYQLELFTDRKDKKCIKCKQWHNENNPHRIECLEYKEEKIPYCKDCFKQMVLLFEENKTYEVIIEKAYCLSQPPWFGKEKKDNSFHDPYIYIACRQNTENNDDQEIVLSSVYVMRKNNGKMVSGSYGPYFSINNSEKSKEVIDMLKKAIGDIDQIRKEYN